MPKRKGVWRTQRGGRPFKFIKSSNSRAQRNWAKLRNAVKSGKYRSKNYSIVRVGTYQPAKTYVAMTYTERTSTKFTVATGSTHTWRGNSLFDPYFTGGGSQPMGFDQICTKYARYRVHGAKIMVTCVNLSTIPVEWIICATKNSTITTWEDMRETPGCSRRKICSSVNSGSAVSYCNQYRSTRYVFGISPQQVGDRTYSADCAANPGTVWYYHLIGKSVDGSSTPNVQIEVTIKYFAEFYERVPMLGS